MIKRPVNLPDGEYPAIHYEDGELKIFKTRQDAEPLAYLSPITPAPFSSGRCNFKSVTVTVKDNEVSY